MTNELFNDDQSNPSSSDLDENKNYFEELVGEGKKYKDPNALAKGSVYKDNHIGNLEKELADLREEFNKRLTYEELMEKITEVNKASNRDESNEPNHGSHEKPENVEDVKTLVETMLNQKFNQHKQETVAERNLSVVRSELEKAWGTDYVSKLLAKAKELNVDEAYMDNLAKERPQVFLNLVLPKVQNQSYSPAPPKSTISVDTSGSGVPKYSDYKKMLTSGDPKVARKFLDPEVQSEIHKLTARYGDEFLNR